MKCYYILLLVATLGDQTGTTAAEVIDGVGDLIITPKAFILVYMDQVAEIGFGYEFNTTTSQLSEENVTGEEDAASSEIVELIIHQSVSDTKLVDVVDPHVLLVNTTMSAGGNFSVTLRGILPGRAYLNLRTNLRDDDKVLADDEFEIAIVKNQGILDEVFTVGVQVLVFIANAGLGCSIDLAIVKANMMRPTAPAIGLFSQFIIMPLVAFAAVNILRLEEGMALGLFTLGIAPGGSASNMLTFLLGGNITLSITMTFISTVCATAFIPLWMYTLGTYIISGSDIAIPYTDILQSLALIISPLILGLIIQFKIPKLSKFCANNVKYLMGVFLVFILTVGLYVNHYVFLLLSYEILIAAAMLPYLGFFLGGLVAFLLRRDRKTVMTIAVETGIQNTGISMMILRLSMSGPEAATAIVAPLVSSLLTPLPLWGTVAVLMIRRRLAMIRARNNGDVEKEIPPPQKAPELKKSSVSDKKVEKLPNGGKNAPVELNCYTVAKF